MRSSVSHARQLTFAPRTPVCPVASTQGRSRLLKSGPARRLRPCDGRHKLSADIAHPRHAQHKQRHVVTWRYEARAERKARDTRTGLAAEPLVYITDQDQPQPVYQQYDLRRPHRTRAWVGRSVVSVCMSACLPVRVVKRKRLELSVHTVHGKPLRYIDSEVKKVSDEWAVWVCISI